MPKSMPSPTNSAKKPTEITLKAPTRKSPQATEIASPIVMLTATAPMIRSERRASQRIARTARIDAAAFSPAFCLTAPNSSSSIGISPVTRTRAPYSAARRRSAAVRLIASVAARPGSKALKSSLGCTSMSRRRSRGSAGFPLASTCQEKTAGRPARTASIASADIGSEGPDQSIGAHQPAHLLLQRVLRQVEQPIALEEGATLRLTNGGKHLGLGFERLLEPAGRPLDAFRGRGIDHDEDFPLAKCAEELLDALAPRQVGRYQVVDVGLDREMPLRVHAGQARENQRKDNDPPRMSGAAVDDANDGCLEHGAPVPFECGGRDRSGGLVRARRVWVRPIQAPAKPKLLEG